MEAPGKSSNHHHHHEGTRQPSSSPNANDDVSLDNHSISSSNGKKRSHTPSADTIVRHGHDCGGHARCPVEFRNGVGETEGTAGRASEEENLAEAVESSGADEGPVNSEMAAVAMARNEEKRPRLSQDARPVESADVVTVLEPRERSVSEARSSGKQLTSLRLEAIFHPKFENESSDKDVRQGMLQKIQRGEGYLEVTLKHSGSLLLWSGGSRFYSKNSANNTVTLVGEFLLRQHMARLWNDRSRNNSNPESINQCTNYDECSTYLQTHRITLAFEVIAPSILGDHGSIPKRSFLILLAAADRTRQQFYTTRELISFAHRFRLPHNDYWIFTSWKGAEKVFEFYDDVREIGTADRVVKGLDQLVDRCHYGDDDDTIDGERTTRRIVSMHPHLEYQGDILEGLVVRFVPGSRKEVSDGVLAGDDGCDGDDLLASLKDLALNSKTYLDIASTAILTETKSSRDGTILSKNILDFFPCDDGVATEDERSLRTYLAARYGSQQCQRMELIKGMEAKTEWNISSWMQDLKSSVELDDETNKIVRVIDTLAEMNARVEYKLFREAKGLDDHDVSMEGCEKTSMEDDEALQSQCQRLICIVHIIHDTTFKKYNDVDVLDKQQTQKLDQKKSSNDNQISPRNISSNTPIDTISPLQQELSERRYLRHLLAFEKAYRQRSLLSRGPDDSYSIRESKCKFRGLILVVSLTKETSTKFCEALAEKLGVLQLHSDLQCIDETSILSSLQEDGRGGIICSIQVDDNKKPLMALIKTNHYNEAIHIVLVGCAQTDIDSRYEAESRDHKRISGIAKSWKRLKCKYIHDLPNLPDFMDLDDDGTPSQVRICSQVEELLDKLTVASNALPSQDTRPGLLVFFPGIPGCGKSSLCGNSDIQEVLTKKCSEIWDSRNNNRTSIESQFQDRRIAVFEGDKIEGKYWPHILKRRLEQPSSITIADKNSTPNAWDIIKEVSEKSKAVPLPILPDATALSTTIVKSQPHAQSCYPFSLLYLATCILRVLTRPAGTHNGKLDSETETACMIVVKFYCLYRGISAEDMSILILNKVAFSYCDEDCRPIVTVPFFKGCNLELPPDLQNCLMDALRLQTLLSMSILEKHSIDTKTGEVNEEDVISMETRLRDLILLHQESLKSMTIPVDESREQFLSQIASKVMDLDDNFQMKNSMQGRGLQHFIEIASIDVDVKEIRDILSMLASHDVDVRNFFDGRGGIPVAESSVADSIHREHTDLVLGTFVEKTHVTMAHFSQLSQQKIRDTYGHLEGNSVSVSVTDLIIGESVAAFSVMVPEKTDGEKPRDIPPPRNSYAHITIWFGEGESAARSNDLPSMVERGEAKRVVLSEAVQVCGKIGYWFI
ncbi:hypothetical protein ACHAXS_008682 [Conticribra weissflogii]